ncbi:MAG: YlxR family protein [Erysipelotrichia bacterium]|nr:YlxR family protein [Erysipelotrichia bacterium]NCC53944.1 YlxR family protein [Erysipelotrichia bacterium]
MKKIPLRKCVATQEQLPKKELIRVVRTPEKKVIVDKSGKANGRGAYLKKSLEAIDIAQKKKVLNRALNVEVDEQIFTELRALINE